MYYSSKSGIEKFIEAIITIPIFISICIGILLTILFIWNYILSIIAIIASILIVCVIIYLIFRYRFYHKKCKHDTIGGEYNNKCNECINEKKEQERIKQLELEEKLKLEKIKRENEKKERNKLFKNKSFIRILTPKEFEFVLAYTFKQLGYSVVQTPYSKDGGKDLILYKNGIKELVECKHYNAKNTIGRPDIQKFFAAMIDESVRSGFYINTGKFTKDALNYANSKNIKCFNLDDLIKLMKKAFPDENNGILDSELSSLDKKEILRNLILESRY
jgi:HJR/Mrr/RecB family endonuclease